MNRLVRSLVWGILPLVLMIAGISALQAQTGSSVFDPEDQVAVYNPSNPPAEPAFGKPGKWVKKNRVNWNTSSFKAYIYKGVQFRLKWPKNYDASGNTKYPLFVFFHGRGEWGDKYDNEYQLYHGGELHKNAVDNGQFNGFLLYPQASVNQGPWSTNERRFIVELIEAFLIPEVNVDPFRISVDGLSAGGLATWNSLKENPSLFAACLPISDASTAFNNLIIDNKFTPIWLFQGALDSDPVPTISQSLKNVADNAGANFTYTEYPNLGHGAWYAAWSEPDYFPFLSRAYKSNPWPLGGRTEFCNTGEPGAVNTVIGVSTGFNEYQWSKNGELLTGPGTTSNTLTVTDIGVYSCRVRKGTTWSEWSPIPVEIKYKTSTIPPQIKVSGLASRVLPAPDGKTTVSLEVPPGYKEYNWQKEGDPASTPPLSTGNVLNGATAGDYKVQVTEQFGCSSAFTEPFKVINADGPDKPDAATGLIVIPLSYTSLKLNWSANPSPVYPQTGFEIYQATKPGGPYQFVSLVNGDVFSFVREGLTPGVKYYYIVRAVNNTSAAPVSNEASATTQKDTAPPTAPGNLQVAGTNRYSVSLAWEESMDDVGMDHYEIYINGIKSYVTPEKEYTVYGLDFGKSYNFTVKAVDIAGNKSAPSNQVTAQPLAKGLTFKHYTGTWDLLPDFNTLTPISTGVVPNVTLANASQAENYAFLWEGFIRVPDNGYYVFSTTSDDGSKMYLDLNSSHTSSPYNHTATAIVDNDELHGTETENSSRIQLSAGIYPIAITFFQKGGGANMSISWKRVSSGGGTTYWSGAIPDSAFVEPASPPSGTVPAKPSNLAATAVSFKRINLTWSDNSNNEKAFELYRSTDPLSNFVTIGVLPANTTSFADTLVEPATTYYYKARAINQYGESPFDKIGPGVDYAYYEKTGMTAVPDFNTMTPLRTGRVNTFGLGMQLRADNFALKFEGSINIVTGGNYTFYLKSDDGSQLYIDGTRIVNNDGPHNADNEIPGNVNLGAGTHSIRVTFFEATGSEVLIVKYEGPGVAKQEIPANVLGDILANATTMAAPPAPAAPGGLTAKGISSSAIKVVWVNNATDANGIELYRSYNGNTDYVMLAVLPSNATSYNDTELYPSSLFYYKVRAIGEGGGSAYSNEKDARTLGVVPSVLPIENVYMRFSSTVNVQVEAISGSPIDITLQVNNLPSFAVFNQTGNGKGVITFNPSASDAGVYSKIAVTASTPMGDINTAQFNLTVNDNYVPHITAIPNSSVAEKSTLQVDLSATDNDAGDRLMWSYSGLPGFATAASSNRSAALTFKPQYGDEGEYRIKAYVSDGRNGKDTASFILKVTHTDVSNPNDGTVPLNPKDVTGVFVSSLNGVKISWTNAAYNALRNEIYRSTYMTGGYTLLNPDATNKDETSYVDYTAAGNKTFYYLVRAVNANGGSNSLVAKVVTPNRAPVISAEDDRYIKSSSVVDMNVAATDDPGDAIQLTASRLPSFATFTDNGNGNGTLHLAPTGSHIGTYDDITITATDNNGAVSSKIIKVTVTDEYITSIFVNFNNKDYPVSYKSWNSFNATQVGSAQVAKNTKISNLKEETGEITTIAVELLDNWPQHYEGVVTGNDSGIFPDSIMMSGYHFTTQANAPYKTIKISGLNNDKTYNLVFFGGTTRSASQLTYFTAGGQTVSLEASKNSSKTVQINGLQASAGSIDVVINGVSGKNAVINALVIQEYDNTVIQPPVSLKMLSSTKNSITLSWKSNAGGVTAFEVWRSDAPNGTYVKRPGTIPGNTFTYTDQGLATSTTYYYKVRAVSGSSYSEFSDYAGGATIKYSININFNDGIAPQPLPWNNTDLLYKGYKLPNLVDDNNQPTGINLTILDNFSGFNNWGMTTGNNSGVVPDNVMQEFYYIQYGETARLMVEGLNYGNKYNFTFFGSCDNRAIGTLIGLYTIGDKTVQLDARNNTQNTIQISDVEPDALGRVIITLRSLAPGYGFVNSINIQAIPLSAGQSGGGSSPRKSSSDNTVKSYLMTEDNSVMATSEEVVTAYPVPVVDDIMLRLLLNKPVERLEATLLNVNGHPLYSQELRGLIAGRNERKLNLNARNLLPGVYFIRVSGWKDGTFKIVKVSK